MTTVQPTVPGWKLPQHAGLWALALAVVLPALIALFGRSVVEIFKSFLTPEFSHGYVIFAITAWIIWQRRALLVAYSDRGAWSGLLLVGGGAMIGVVGHAANFVTPPFVGLVIFLLGLAAMIIGWRAARLLIIPFGFLLLAYPIPDYLFIEISTTLQLLSSQIGAAVLQALGIPVYLDGNIIDLGSMKLQVAEACSGLRYLLPLMTFGVLCVFMYRAPLWAKFLIVAATIPLAILLNGLRIAFTGVIMDKVSVAMAEGFMHFFEGWVVFLIALAMLFGLMWALLRLIGWRGGFTDMLDFDRMAGTPSGRSEVVLRNGGAGGAGRQETMITKALTAALGIGLAALALIPIQAREHVIPDRPGLFSLPLAFGEWRATQQFLDPRVVSALDTPHYFLADFTHPSMAEDVNLWIAYYDALGRGSYIHSPTTCLPGAGWEFTKLDPHDTGLVDYSGEPLIVNRSIVVKGAERIVMYFWTEIRGRSVEQFQRVKLHNLWDSFTIGRTDGALVRVYTRLQPDEAPAAADARLLAFLERSYGAFEPHVGR